MDTQDIVTTSRLENLRARGVEVTHLHCISRYERRWSIKAAATMEMERDTFKRLVEHFLEHEYLAAEFSWKREVGEERLVAFCSFKCFVL